MIRLAVALWMIAPLFGGDLESARDRQDRAALEQITAALEKKKPSTADGLYRLAVAYSYLGEVSQELRDKAAAQRAAEAGIRAAERAIELKPGVAEYHRILGTLCGQVIPANVLTGLSFGKRAKESIDKALSLDPKSAAGYLSRGVGNYYLPQALGGGAERAMRDFEKSIELDPKSADAHLWLGLALRKLNRNADSRRAFEHSLQLNPHRLWAKQQLEKTPAN